LSLSKGDFSRPFCWSVIKFLTTTKKTTVHWTVVTHVDMMSVMAEPLLLFFIGQPFGDGFGILSRNDIRRHAAATILNLVKNLVLR